MLVLFFFKQKTAYEMRISDWSSDVCSSDLYLRVDDDLYDVAGLEGRRINPAREIALVLGVPQREVAKALEPMGRLRRSGMIQARSGDNLAINQIGRASCRERVCQYV